MATPIALERKLSVKGSATSCCLRRKSVGVAQMTLKKKRFVVLRFVIDKMFS